MRARNIRSIITIIYLRFPSALDLSEKWKETNDKEQSLGGRNHYIYIEVGTQQMRISLSIKRTWAIPQTPTRARAWCISNKNSNFPHWPFFFFQFFFLILHGAFCSQSEFFSHVVAIRWTDSNSLYSFMWSYMGIMIYDCKLYDRLTHHDVSTPLQLQ